MSFKIYNTHNFISKSDSLSQLEFFEHHISLYSWEAVIITEVYDEDKRTQYDADSTTKICKLNVVLAILYKRKCLAEGEPRIYK